MNFIALLESDGSTLKRTAATHGGEWAGACPWCGGKDRFRVWPKQDGGRYWCRNCGKHGDAIQSLRDKRGLTFQDACRYTGRDPGPQASATHPVPAAASQEGARTLFNCAITALWTEQDESMREWLRAKKGLQDVTIEQARLGNRWRIYLNLGNLGDLCRHWKRMEKSGVNGCQAD